MRPSRMKRVVEVHEDFYSTCKLRSLRESLISSAQWVHQTPAETREERRSLSQHAAAEVSRLRALETARTAFSYSFFNHETRMLRDQGVDAISHALGKAIETRLVRFCRSHGQRQLTGCQLEMRYSAFCHSDFIKAHTDALEIDGNRRIAAFVLFLNPKWRPDFGGLLHFCDRAGEVSKTIVPRLNRLVIFSVPTTHFVSSVSEFSCHPRLAVSGWLISSEH